MTAFCHISPTAYLNTFVPKYSHHLTLAHLVESDDEYRKFYRDLRRTEDSCIILDNSAFELYKEGKPMYPSEKLIEMGQEIDADYIVMSDYPGQDSSYTIEAAKELAPKFHQAGFGTFFVPQSCVNDLDDLSDCFQWAAHSELVDYIGVSILSAPNAFGVERGNKMQRFLSRWKLMRQLEYENILDIIFYNKKKMHFLGMVDGPNEIDLVAPWIDLIDTWDSSAAIWAGLNNIQFDSSPTGLIDGKFELPVDFNHTGATYEQLWNAQRNMDFIDGKL